MTSGSLKETYLTGQLLVAMPNMGDPRFDRSVIYLCHHDGQGAMGLVVNKLLGDLNFGDLVKQFEIKASKTAKRRPIHFGGPVEPGRGFVLHSAEYSREGTMMVGDLAGVTATVEALRDLAQGQGPQASLIALGYAGWGAGQLDSEIQQNAWLNAPADQELIFGDQQTDKWLAAIRKLGIDPSLLSTDAGHA